MKTDIERVFALRFTKLETKLLDIDKSQQFQADQYESFWVQVGKFLRINTELKAENENLVRRIYELEKKDEQRAKSSMIWSSMGREKLLRYLASPKVKTKTARSWP